MISFEKSFLLSFKLMGIISLLFLLYMGIAKGHTMYLFYFKLKNNDKVYAYDDFSNDGLHPIVYTENEKHLGDLINFYEKQLHDINSSLPFEPKFAPIMRPIYVVNYIDKDSAIIEFIDIETCCWGYIHGYLYSKTIHTKPPSPERIQ